MSETNLPLSRNPYLLRFAFGLVYLQFGILKLFPDLSPAEMISTQTIIRLSSGVLDAHSALLLLAIFEIAIGLGFVLDLGRRWLPWIFLAHMAGTALPLVLLPELVFKIAPFAPTMEGQYIMKNIVFVAAGWTILAPRIVFPNVRRLRSRSRAARHPIRDAVEVASSARSGA